MEQQQKSQVRLNAESDPKYCPYCLRCSGNIRMRKVGPFRWECGCGAKHDEVRPEDPPVAIKLGSGCSQIILYCKHHFGNTYGRDHVEDMRKLVANRNMGTPAWISDYDMMLSLLAVLRDVKKLPIEDHTMSHFMSLILFGGRSGAPILPDKYKGPFAHFVDAVCGIFACLQIRQHNPVTGELQDLITLAPLDEKLGKMMGFEPKVKAADGR